MAVIWIYAAIKILWLILKGLYYILFDMDGGYFEAIKKTPEYKAFENELNDLL